MKYIEFDETRKMDLVLLGRVAIDFNPAYNDQVKEEFKPLKKVHMFEKFVGGSPANIAVGVTRHGLKTGFIGKVSDDQFGEFVTDYFNVLSGKLNDALSGRLFYADFGSHGGNSHFKNGCFCELFS
ncbi:hypothetical protein B5G27_08090 [Lachnoclostridium sp. An76]|nr:PfkB family carbohydrate kinase [Lachnoclostridium sp. An76]OUN34677.1 hypothetical protein B5G27_08090 [Lachnoclostridium sp. An76]